MKSSLVAAFLLAISLSAYSLPQASAQGRSEEWLSEVGNSNVVDSFGGYHGRGKCADDCDCYTSPTWTFGADAVFMQRGRPDSLVLMQDAAAPARNLNADAFGFDFTTGWDVSLERNTINGGLEARLLSIDGWNSATTAMVGPPPTLVRINNFVPFFLPGVTSVNATYNSELLSAELNLRRRLTDRINLLGGFRYLELDEHFHATLNAAVLPSTYDTATQNRLYGGQLGADATLWCGDRLTVEGLLKAGIFHNIAGQNTILDTGVVVVNAADDDDRVAFLGELAFTANYCLTDTLSLRAGYDLLWVETVALAADQIPATNFFTGGGIAADGGAFYHGAFVGLEYRR